MTRETHYDLYLDAVDRLNSIIEDIRIKCAKKEVNFNAKVPLKTIKIAEMLVATGLPYQINNFASTLETLYGNDIQLND
ncbi:MAG: hypothetical protein FI730_03220 [SAR202 cluster bacterium]|nr:hypothetical protein [SAR202 cluster bacterium]